MPQDERGNVAWPSQFLVNITFHFPDSVSSTDRSERLRAEAEYARELVASGNLLRLWRVPGRRENWGLWQADDATMLHELIAHLPMFDWADVRVIPLAHHPHDPATD